MEHLRFFSSQRYKTLVPLPEMQFRVTIYKAFVVEETKREEVCQFVVGWDQKLFSPRELLDLYCDVQRQHSAGPGADGDGDGAGAGGPVLLPLEGDGERGRTWGEGVLPTRGEAVEQLSSPHSRFFTRPPTEDFIDVSQEECPVDPPLGPSLLAPVILRQHRKDQQPNSNMYLMWADGVLSNASPQTSSGSYSYADLEWTGTERVFMTITAERDEHFFSTKPTLGEMHTLLVDALSIYSFVVQPCRPQRSAAVPASPASPSLVPRPRHSSVVSEATARLASSASVRYENASASATAAARALLRQVAQVTFADTAPVVAKPRAVVPSGRASSNVRMRSPSITRREVMRRIHVFGVVERSLGLQQDSVYLFCQIVRDASAFDYVHEETSRTPSDFTTQMAYLQLAMHDAYVVSPEHVFNTPFEHTYEEVMPAASPLRLVVTAFSEGPGGASPQYAVGYGSVSIPMATPGRHDLRVPLWAPHPNGSEFVRMMLVGGAPTLVDSRQAAAPLPVYRRTGIAVREGIATDSTGEVSVVVNVFQQRIEWDPHG